MVNYPAMLAGCSLAYQARLRGTLCVTWDMALEAESEAAEEPGINLL